MSRFLFPPFYFLFHPDQAVTNCLTKKNNCKNIKKIHFHHYQHYHPFILTLYL